MNKRLALVLISFIAFHSNSFAMEKKQEMAKAEQVKLTKLDFVKIAAASVGCTFFGMAAAMTYPQDLRINSFIVLI